MWPNRPPYITLVIAHIRHREVHDFLFCWKCFLIKPRRRKKKLQAKSKVYFQQYFMIISFVNWSMQYCNWQTNISPPRKLGKKKKAHTHTQTLNSNWHFLNVNNTSPAPPNLEEMKKRRKCQRANWQTSGFHNIPLYLSICIRLFVSLLFSKWISLEFGDSWSAACGAQINKND